MCIRTKRRLSGMIAWLQRALGYVKDATGLYYCQNRYYDPANGRWLTRDPIGYEGGINLYGYCGGGPVGAVDREGLYMTPSQCAALKARITSKAALLAKELAKYNPFTDFTGGDKWKPYGHYREIVELQRGIMKDLETYARECWFSGPPPPVPRNAFESVPLIRPLPNGSGVPEGGIPGHLPGIPRHETVCTGVAATVASGAVLYLAYLGVKWAVAGTLAVPTGGGSLIIAGATP